MLRGVTTVDDYHHRDNINMQAREKKILLAVVRPMK